MAVRTAYVATESAGDVLTAANFNKMPGGCIGYANVTANQTGISALADLTGLTVTVTVNTSRLIMVQGLGVFLQQTGVGTASMAINEGATQLVNAGASLVISGFGTFTPFVILSPSSGAHTYKLRATTSSNTVDLQASATAPATIAVYDMGPAF